MPKFTIDCPPSQPELPDFNSIEQEETNVHSVIPLHTYHMYYGKWNSFPITRKLTTSKNFTSKLDVYQRQRNGHLEQFKIINSTREHSWIDEQVGQVTLVQKNYEYLGHWLKAVYVTHLQTERRLRN
jgi:hypothetical protein